MPELIKTMQLFDYAPNLRGMCFGISVMATQAALRKNNKLFANRIKFIQNCSEAEIETIKNSEKDNEQNFNRKLDLMCFFDGISIYQGKDGVCSDFKLIASNIQNINDTIKIIKLKALENDDEFTYPEIKMRLMNVYTREEFLHFIKAIKKHIGKQPFSIIIHHSPINHASQIGFDEKNWLSTNHDLILSSEDNSEGIEKIVNNVFLPTRYGSTDRMVATFDILLPEAVHIDLEPLKAYDFSLNDLTDSVDKEMLSHILACSLKIFRYDTYLNILQKISSLELIENEKIALIESKYVDNTTVLHGVAFYGKLSILNQILEMIDRLGLSLETKISIINKKNNRSFSSLHYAAQNGHRDIVCELIKIILSSENQVVKIEGLNAINDEGKSALFAAARNGHENVVRILIKAICSLEEKEARIKLLTLTNKEGESALSIAERRNDQNIVKLLRAAITKERRLLSENNYRDSCAIS